MSRRIIDRPGNGVAAGYEAKLRIARRTCHIHALLEPHRYSGENFHPRRQRIAAARGDAHEVAASATYTMLSEEHAEEDAMMSFETAVAGYLHRTDRPAPWNRRREEDALDGLSGWLHPTRGTLAVDAVTPQLISRYAAERRLRAEELEELCGTLAGLSRWARGGRAAPLDPPSFRTRMRVELSPSAP